jgi:hypothetical protein
MGVPGSANLLLLGGEQGYKISRSLRFNSADSAYLNRTPASAGNRRTFTWSGWVKRSKLGDENKTFTAGSSGIITYLQFQDNVTDGLTFARYTGTHTFRLSTTQVFRDSSAWYHITLAVDTTQATDTNRVKIYVNGTQITVFTTATYPAQNLDLEINNTNDHRIGSGSVGFSSSGYLDGYLTEINFIDGQALTPSSFGETDTITGVWKPKKYAGTYGTNGFYLNFSDNSGTTSTTLGKDSSGNSNNWTPNNFSVTAGAGNDSLIDTPTPYADGGNGRGNYCTLNPLDNGGLALANGNLEGTYTAAAWRTARATFAITSGKWYWEISSPNATTSTSPYQAIIAGIAKSAATLTSYVGSDASGWSYFNVDGTKYTNGSSAAYGSTWTSANTIGIAFDADNGTLTFYRDNTSQGTAFTGLTSGPYFPAVSCYSGSSVTAVCNFGQRPFAYTPPSGFVALNTQNLPEPSIKKPSSYMDVVTYTGTGSALTPTSSLGFSPDLVWIKGRSGATDHALYDAVRGVQLDLVSNSTAAETTQTQGLTAFNSNGFNIGTLAKLNTSTATYVAWCWDESATPGFDIVTYTGTGANRTISHSLGVAPKMIIVKDRTSGTNNWVAGHDSIAWTNRLYLNDTSASTAASTTWNNTAPTSSVFSVGTSTQTNTNGNNYVAYLWSEVAGFSKFGSYTGNGSSDGPFLHCGFRPAFVIFKSSSSGYDWFMFDNRRDPENVVDLALFPNSSSAESGGSTYMFDFTANGIKIRNSQLNLNGSGNTYIFAAFAEAPFKYALAR